MAVQLLAFFFVVFGYAFQGIANGGAYAGKSLVQYVGIALQVLLVGAVLLFVPLSFMNIALATLAVASIVLTKISFVGFKYGDVHLYTYLTSILFLLLVAYDLSVFGALGMYAGLLLEKGFINIGSKLSFFDDRTDDIEGKTFGIPLLGIKVPRLRTEYRIPLAVFSLFLVGVAALYKYNITLHQLILKYI